MNAIATFCASLVEATLDLAIEAFQAGDIAEAQTRCRDVMTAHPREPGALHLLAMIACGQGEPAQALGLLDVALREDPAQARLHNTRAEALAALGRAEEAEAAYRHAWSLRPGSAPIANNLACLLRDKGQVAEAVIWFRRADAALPDVAEIVCNLACALAASGAVEAARAEFERALALSPGCPDVLGHYAAMLLAAGQAGAAERLLHAALQTRPGHAASLNNLALALQAQHRPEIAIDYLREAVHAEPGFADAWYNLGCLLLLDGRQEEARECQDRAVKLAPLHGRALWARCMAELPVFYQTQAQVARQRTRYASALGRLEALAANPAIAGALAASAGSSQPFFLPYQGELDAGLQARYGGLMARIQPAHGLDLADPPRPGERVRLGIVSGFFCEHTVWRLMLKGWLREIDRDRFDVTAYATMEAGGWDSQTALARRLCPRFITGGVTAIRDAILADRPHVLLYPEIGMDPGAARLASERLAPTQAVCWGQPETTGLPTMDFFFSSAAMEPENAAEHYTERLVSLPNLGLCYDADERTAAAVTRAELGLRETATVFWCPQTLQKYLPQHDDLLARIAQGAGDCQFAFIGFAKSRDVTGQFYARMSAAFAARGLNPARYLVMLPPLSQERFLGAAALADIVLDSIGWSGGKSTLDMLAAAPVIVTYAGRLMRGRHTTAILNGMGVTDTVVTDLDDYVGIALALAGDPASRGEIRARMVASRHRVLADVTPIRAMEDVLISEAMAEREGRSIPRDTKPRADCPSYSPLSTAQSAS